MVVTPESPVSEATVAATAGIVRCRAREIAPVALRDRRGIRAPPAGWRRPEVLIGRMNSGIGVAFFMW